MNRHQKLTRTAAHAAALLVLLTGVAATDVSASAATKQHESQRPGDGGDERPKGDRGKHHELQPGESPDILVVKFAGGTDVRVRGNRLVSAGNTDMTAFDEVLSGFPGTRVDRLFDGASEEQHDQLRQDAEARSQRPHADLNLYFRIELAPNTDITAVVDALNGLDIVENAAPEPTPVPLPATLSFVGGQGYRTGAATGGIDADYAQTVPGGKGENVIITDVEYSWNRTHEDLSKAMLAGSALANGTPCDPFATQQGAHASDHGTAVLGQIFGDANAFGVTGLAPGAGLRTVNASSRTAAGSCNYNLANAINIAANNSVAGDVILIEQQIKGPRFTGTTTDKQFGLVPVEWDNTGAVWSAISNATARGVIVVEAAGNGSQNLDDPIYNDSTGRNWFSYDSGAIIVGAGMAPGCTYGSDPTTPRGRLSYSNHGSRLNVQAWGNCVMTTGYGDYQGGTNPNLWYTASFGGTSSASPIVASGAAILSSVAESRGTTLTPAQVRTMLAATGQPQAAGNPGNIGPLPNLRAAINALGPKLADGGHVLNGTKLTGTTIPVKQTWTNLTGGTVQYEVYLATDTGAFVNQTLSSPTTSAATFQLERNHNYQFAARAKDASGVWGDWAYSPKFHVGAYEENYSAGNPVYSSGWARTAWTSASSGYVALSSQAGSSATFSFTGRSFAWIASKATNRGQADVYVDGVLAGRVDLYSATTVAQAVAFTRTWSTSGSHTVEVRVVGTAGRPKVDVDAFVRFT